MLFSYLASSTKCQAWQLGITPPLLPLLLLLLLLHATNYLKTPWQLLATFALALVERGFRYQTLIQSLLGR